MDEQHTTHESSVEQNTQIDNTDAYMDAPTKPPVSRFAIAALMCGVGSWLTCCAPGVTHVFGAIALVLAAIGAVRIKTSVGRLRGGSACVLAIVLATVGMSVGTAALAMNAVAVNQQKAFAGAIVSIRDGASLADAPKLSEPLRALLTQDDLDTFAMSITDQMGAFEFQPKTITETFRTRWKVSQLGNMKLLGPLMQERFAAKKIRVQPMRFANGWAVAILVSPTGPNNMKVVDNLGFVAVASPAGTEPVWLIAPELMP